MVTTRQQSCPENASGDTGAVRKRRRRWLIDWTTLAALVVVSLLTTTVPPATAQAGPAIAGTVRSTTTGEPVAGAHVAALRTTDYSMATGTVAGPDGAYTLDDLAAGTYLLYLIDPTGQHAAGFHGAPGVVTVATTGTVAVDPLMAPGVGSIAGVVTDDSTGVAIAGAWVGVLNGTTGGIEAGTVADGSGAYAIDGLAPGLHFLVSIDPSGAHRTEFHDDAPSIIGATRISIAPGAVTTVDPALAATVSSSPGTTIHGTVTEAGTGIVVPATWVVALDAATMSLAGGAVAASDGTYSLRVAAGRYLLAFVEPSGQHAMEWYDEQDSGGLATAMPVDVGTDTQIDEDLAPTTGALTGTVREDASNDPVPGAWVVTIGPHGVRAAATAPDGTYRVGGLAAGTYRAAFVDADGGRGVEYWDGSPDYAGAAPMTVPAGGETEADVSLRAPRCGDPGAPLICVPAYPTPLQGPGWSKYTIPVGAHPANVSQGAQATAPLAGFTSVAARRFHFAFDATARYVLTNPTQPEDQFDWNKLPGLSDCPGFLGLPNTDLSQNGWMFGWRWRTDLVPRVLEITAYANNNGVHLTPPAPLVTLTAAQLDAGVPLWFELDLSPDGQRYQFRVAGPGSRSATASLPRSCPTYSPTALKWASGFYFGGTSTAPNEITGWINEP